MGKEMSVTVVNVLRRRKLTGRNKPDQRVSESPHLTKKQDADSC